MEDAPGLIVDDIPDEEESNKCVEPCDQFYPIWSVGEEPIRNKRWCLFQRTYTNP